MDNLNKRILISSYYFYPEKTPRAFRAFELAKEFAKRKYNVEVLIPNNNYDYSNLEKKYNIKINKVASGFLFNKKKLLENKIYLKKNNIFYKIIKPIISKLYFDGRVTEYTFTLLKFLLKFERKFDIFISIGLPFSTHLAAAISRKINNIALKYIADYGDPFSYNPIKKQPFYIRQLEKFTLSVFDYIVIPVSTAKKAFEKFDIDDKIRVIPQGLDFSQVKILKYTKNEIPTFAYAGNFYVTIRNPKKILEFLVNYKNKFIFDIYCDFSHRDNFICLNPYLEKLKGKLFIKPLLPRYECIKLLSKYDFLININNKSDIQIPSKIIDYMLTKRPIFNCSHDFFDEKLFIDMLNFNFDKKSQIKIDIEKFNICNIADMFLKI